MPWKDPSSGIARRPRRSEFPRGLHGFRCGRKRTSRSVRQQDPNLFRARSTGLEIACSQGELVGGTRPLHAQLDGTSETWVGAGTGTLSADTPGTLAFPARPPGFVQRFSGQSGKPSALRVLESARWGRLPPGPGMPGTWLTGWVDGPPSAWGWLRPRLLPAQLRLPPPGDALQQLSSRGDNAGLGIRRGRYRDPPLVEPDERAHPVPRRSDSLKWRVSNAWPWRAAGGAIGEAQPSGAIARFVRRITPRAGKTLWRSCNPWSSLRLPGCAML